MSDVADPLTDYALGGLGDGVPLARSPATVAAEVASIPSWGWWAIILVGAGVALYLLYRWFSGPPTPAPAPAPAPE